jgi:transcriptional regulator with XRE-family HTH domain
MQVKNRNTCGGIGYALDHAFVKRDETFGIRLRYYRSIAGVSQGELAEEMEQSHKSAPSQRDLSLYEADRSFPRLEKFAALVDALDLTKEEVMGLVRLAERRKIPMSHSVNSVDEKAPARTVSEPGTESPPASVPGNT